MAEAGALSPEVQKRIEEVVETKVASAMKNVEQRFAEMMSSLDQKQKALNVALEAAEARPSALCRFHLMPAPQKERQELERVRGSKIAPALPEEPYEKRWYRDCPFEVRDCPGKGRVRP